MGLFDDLKCTGVMLDPFFWKAVAGLQLSKSAGLFSDQAGCMKVAGTAGGAIGSITGLPEALTGAYAECACKYVCDDDAPVPSVWHQGLALGGQISGAPSAVLTADGVIDLYVCGEDRRLRQRWWKGGWSPAFETVAPGESFGMGSAPCVVSLNAHHRAVFACSRGGGVHHKDWDGSWHPWQSLGGVIKGSPGVVRTADKVIDVYARGMDDRLWQRYWNGAWSPSFEPVPLNPSFKMGSSPLALSLHPQHRIILARGSDGALWHADWDGSWHDWQSLGGEIKDAPGGVVTADGIIDIYVHGMDDRLWQRYWNGGWSPGFVQISPDFVVNSSPSVVSLERMHRSVFVRGSDDAVWELGWGP